MVAAQVQSYDIAGRGASLLRKVSERVDGLQRRSHEESRNNIGTKSGNPLNWLFTIFKNNIRRRSEELMQISADEELIHTCALGFPRKRSRDTRIQAFHRCSNIQFFSAFNIPLIHSLTQAHTIEKDKM